MSAADLTSTPYDAQALAALGEQCLQWNTPDELKGVSDALADLLGDFSMLSPGRSFRESYIASRFAVSRGATLVRLLAEQPPSNTPDFELVVGEERLCFETTEADIPGRRRQDEYRQPRKAELMIFTDLHVIVDRMRELAAKKAEKNYERCQGLVIWINPPAFSFNPKLRWENLVRGGEPAAHAFAEVWAMRGTGSLLWLDGVAQQEIPGEEF